jgi:type VI secretion system protein ImpL
LRKFLREASRETTLQGTASRTVVADSVSTVVKYRVDEAKRRLQSALMPNAERPATIDAGKGLNPVDVHFASLHLLTGAPGASGPVPIDQLLALFRDAAVYFDGADSAQRRGLPAPSPEPLARLKREADSHAAPLNSILKNVGGGGAHLAQGSEHVRLNALWRATGAKFCAQAIAGRYPLTRGATQNVTPDDFGKYFGPGGLSDDFFQKNLAVYADMSGAQWRWRNAGPDSLGFSQEALSSFQHAARIRDMFFSAGGQQPSMRFYLKPLSADDALGKVILDIDGQQVIHVPGGTPAASQIQLPSGKGSGQVRFEIDSIVSQSGFRTEGPWAWLRMIDKGRLEPVGQGEHFKLYMTLNGHSIIYDLNANSVLNPFRLQSMEPFRCPDHL